MAFNLLIKSGNQCTLWLASVPESDIASSGEYGCCLGCAGNGNGACESLLSSRQVEELGKWVLQHSIDVRGRSQNY